MGIRDHDVELVESGGRAGMDPAAAARSAGRPLRGTQVLRVPKYDDVEIPDVTRPYDGLFFIARMERATLIPS